MSALGVECSIFYCRLDLPEKIRYDVIYALDTEICVQKLPIKESWKYVTKFFRKTSVSLS